MEIHGNPKNPNKYSCETCCFYTNHKTRFNQHIITLKHKNLTNSTSHGNPMSKNYFCKYCEKGFFDKSGLWKHNKKCNTSQTLNIIIEQNQTIMTEITELKKQLSQQNQIIVANQKLTNNNNNDKPQTITNVKGDHNNIQNNTYNNTMVFLNTECKDAVNMKQFLDAIKIDVKQLDFMINKKRVNAISDIFNKHLSEYDLYKRPIHCTDTKRLTMYVKENDSWITNEPGNICVKEAINDITKIGVKAIPDWEYSNKPKMSKDDLDTNYMKLVKMLNSNIQDDEYKKIIKTVASNIKLAKADNAPLQST